MLALQSVRRAGVGPRRPGHRQAQRPGRTRRIQQPDAGLRGEVLAGPLRDRSHHAGA